MLVRKNARNMQYCNITGGTHVAIVHLTIVESTYARQ